MKWFIKTNNIILYFHYLLILGLFVLLDYFLFSIALRLYNVYIILLLFALCSGIGVLLCLNTILALLKTMIKNAQLSDFRYLMFIQFIIAIIAGTLIAFPSIITLFLGWILYFKPVRTLIVNLIYKMHPSLFVTLYSNFLIEYVYPKSDKEKKDDQKKKEKKQ